MSKSGQPRLAITLAVVAMLLLAVAISLRILRSRNAPFLQDGPAIVDSFVRDLTSGDPKVVSPYLAPELLRKLEGARLARFLQKYAEFGDVEYVARRGVMRVAVVDSIPYPEVAYYQTVVKYERTPATVDVLLVRTRRDGLKVWSFNIDSQPAEPENSDEGSRLGDSKAEYVAPE